MADQHNQPTPEELQAGIDAALKADDATQDPPIVDDPDPKDPPVVVDDDLTPTGDDIPPADPDDGDPGVTPPVTPTPPKEIDWEKRYHDSSREAHILAEGKKQLEEEVDGVKDLPEPSEEDLRTEYPDWDVLNDSERKLAKKVLHGEMKEAKILSIREKHRADESKISTRRTEMETFSIQPDILKRFPKLEGHQEEFATYASKPSRLPLDPEDLVKLFVMDLPEPKKNNGKMFETGTGGPNGKPQQVSNKITVEQSQKLMQTNYPKYVYYLENHLIETPNLD